ncbi:MAG TPA: thiamine phosphate synthase [Bacillota bacterium]|nr:thiamine phosphate synthase [Bacillota bacterium]
MDQPEFHLLSNGKLELTEFARMASLVKRYVSAIHLREKGRYANEITEGIQHLLTSGVPHHQIYINDRLDVAWALKVKGGHLAYHSLEPSLAKQTFPDLRIGRSVHSLEEALVMEAQGVDYLFFGHIFSTTCKPGKEPQGLMKLEEVTRSVKIPVIAIGGIKPENVESVMNAGASGIAVLSSIVEAIDPLQVVKNYAKALYGED